MPPTPLNAEVELAWEDLSLFYCDLIDHEQPLDH